mmetsp:Transcript_26312/g.68055  ORF Transcript_26312/g.68055 Transcript_26312/m.68055 type:complete len:238 (+) Transcript_26312:422-1135(+)
MPPAPIVEVSPMSDENTSSAAMFRMRSTNERRLPPFEEPLRASIGWAGEKPSSLDLGRADPGRAELGRALTAFSTTYSSRMGWLFRNSLRKSCTSGGVPALPLPELEGRGGSTCGVAGLPMSLPATGAITGCAGGPTGPSYSGFFSKKRSATSPSDGPSSSPSSVASDGRSRTRRCRYAGELDIGLPARSSSNRSGSEDRANTAASSTQTLLFSRLRRCSERQAASGSRSATALLDR